MISERTFSPRPKTNSRHCPWLPLCSLLCIVIAALSLTNGLPVGAEGSRGEKEPAKSKPASDDTATPKADGQPESATPSATGTGKPASGEPSAAGNGQPPGDAQAKPLPLIPEIQALPKIKIPPGKLPVAILLPNFEKFHQAFTRFGRDYSNKRLTDTNSMMRAKLQKNGCYVISEEAAHATSQMVIEIYLTRAKTSLNLMAHGYQINGGISRYKRTPGRLVRIGYNSLGEFDQIYGLDDFESKSLMLTDVFLDRTKNIRKVVAQGGKKAPARKGKKG